MNGVIDDVGKEVSLDFEITDADERTYKVRKVRRVIMSILGPRGWLRLVEPEEQPINYTYHIKAIKAFMDFNSGQDTTIPDIVCTCGTVIVPKEGAVQITCRCGRYYRLYKDGKQVSSSPIGFTRKGIE